MVKMHTTTDLSPIQIHAIGLTEVRRVEGEMRKLMVSVGFKGTLQEFFDFLRTNSRFYYTDKNALISSYRTISKKVDQVLPQFFISLPQLKYEIKAVPEYAESGSASGYYIPGSLKLDREGIFFVNTSQLNHRPKWEMTSLFLHEAIPGHHLQISLRAEVKNIPEAVQKIIGYNAYSEGWALYAESLGAEMEMYDDLYSNFGRLNFEMLRSIRLVLDTGIHFYGWSREKALRYFKAHSALSDHEMIFEVDRYIASPAQALSYKIGEIKIQELKHLAMQKLGKLFDVRRFHQAILENGEIPLDLLKTKVEQWIESENGMK